MGAKISRRGSYNLSKREKKNKKSEQATLAERTSSFISLSQAQIYEDAIKSPVLNNHKVSECHERQNGELVENAEITIPKINASSKPSSDHGIYSSDEELYQNVFGEDAFDPDEQVERRISRADAKTHETQVHEDQQIKKRKSWSKYTVENLQDDEQYYDLEEKSSKHSVSEISEANEQPFYTNTSWKDVLNGVFWAEEKSASEITHHHFDQNKSIERNETQRDQKVHETKNEEVINLASSDSKEQEQVELIIGVHTENQTSVSEETAMHKQTHEEQTQVEVIPDNVQINEQIEVNKNNLGEKNDLSNHQTEEPSQENANEIKDLHAQLHNENSHIIPADAIEKLRDMLQEQKSARADNTNTLQEIVEDEEDVNEQLEICEVGVHQNVDTSKHRNRKRSQKVTFEDMKQQPIKPDNSAEQKERPPANRQLSTSSSNSVYFSFSGSEDENDQFYDAEGFPMEVPEQLSKVTKVLPKMKQSATVKSSEKPQELEKELDGNEYGSMSSNSQIFELVDLKRHFRKPSKKVESVSEVIQLDGDEFGSTSSNSLISELEELEIDSQMPSQQVNSKSFKNNTSNKGGGSYTCNFLLIPDVNGPGTNIHNLTALPKLADEDGDNQRYLNNSSPLSQSEEATVDKFNTALKPVEDNKSEETTQHFQVASEIETQRYENLQSMSTEDASYIDKEPPQLLSNTNRDVSSSFEGDAPPLVDLSEGTPHQDTPNLKNKEINVGINFKSLDDEEQTSASYANNLNQSAPLIDLSKDEPTPQESTDKEITIAPTPAETIKAEPSFGVSERLTDLNHESSSASTFSNDLLEVVEADTLLKMEKGHEVNQTKASDLSLFLNEKVESEKSPKSPFKPPSVITTPEEIAEAQMRQWDDQKEAEIEAVLSKINNIMATISDLRNQIDNLSTEVASDVQTNMYQALIKIMREVNSVDNYNFNQSILDLQHKALNEVHACLRDLREKHTN